MTTRIHLVQRHSHNFLLAHIVWATARRLPLLEPSADAFLAEILHRKARETGCALVACGNASDHVHVLVRYPSTVAVAVVVQRLKGASSYEWNAKRRSPRLSWQSGSWAASVRRPPRSNPGRPRWPCPPRRLPMAESRREALSVASMLQSWHRR